MSTMALPHFPTRLHANSKLAKSPTALARLVGAPSNRPSCSRSLHMRPWTPAFPSARRPSVPHTKALTPFATAFRIGGIRTIFIQTENTPNSDVSSPKIQDRPATDMHRPSNSSLIIPYCQKVSRPHFLNTFPQGQLWPPHILRLWPLGC